MYTDPGHSQREQRETGVHGQDLLAPEAFETDAVVHWMRTL